MHGSLPVPGSASPAPPSPSSNPRGAPVLRLALRDLRAGLRGFGVFIACIALGVAAISGVSSVARSLVEGISTQGRVILGGDVALSVVGREAEPAELAALQRYGTVSAVANLRAMADGGAGGAALVELKAVSPSYPESGAVASEPAGSIGDLLAERGGVFGGLADPALFYRLGLSPGSRITIGAATIELRANLVSEPDKIAAGIGFGPRLIVSQAALRATGLIQPGALHRWTYRVSLTGPDLVPDEALARAVAAIRRDLPEGGAGWEIRARDNADPRFARNVERFTQFLTLVGLTALLVGGVGVANAVAAFVDRKRPAIAILKSLGATSGRIMAICLTEVMLIAMIGIAIGLAIGAALPFGVAYGFAAALPIPITPVLSWADLGIALLYGGLTALAFSVIPLGRAQSVSVSGLFRDRVAPDPRRPPVASIAAAAGAGLLLIGLAVLAAHDRKVALAFVAAAGSAFALLRVVSYAVMAAARRIPHPRNAVLRLALANLHRPGALTPSLVLSLGLGITLLVTLAVIDGSLRQEIGRTLPDRAPNMFFIDVPSGQAVAFRDFLTREVPKAVIEATPMMRGRLTALNGISVSDAKASPNAAWVLEGDRGITYSTSVPEGSVVVEGSWWAPDVTGPPLVSMDVEIARGLGLQLGDSVTVNVLGRSLTAKIANLRRIDWRRIGIGFVLVFSPQSFAGAPHTEILTLAIPKDAAPGTEERLLRESARRFPAVTSVRVKEALEAVNAIVEQLVFAIRAASSVALAASLLVLAGALASGHRARLYDAVVLKTLGATRGRLLAAYLVEYGTLGLITAVFGLVAGSLAGAMLLTRLMRLDVAPSYGWAIGSALGAVLVAVGLGLLGTWRILGQKPARHLRSL